jgi:hypothetical protein
VIVRVARFEAGRGDLGLDRSEWVIEALRGVAGVTALYHCMAEDGSAVSVTVFDDPESAEAAMAKIEEARDRLGIEVAPADDVVVYEVVGSLERP